MEVKVLQVGPIGTNCYLLFETEAKLCAVIDPGADADRILRVIREQGVQVPYILLTHGHYDHTDGVAELVKALPDAAVYIHRGDCENTDPRLFPLRTQVGGLKHYDEGDTLQLGSLTIDVLHTPGHSEGSVTLRCGELLFCGDTLFAGSCGRTDFAGGSMKKMMSSLARLAALEGDYQVLPGHMEFSTLQQERATNPYVQMALRER